MLRSRRPQQTSTGVFSRKNVIEVSMNGEAKATAKLESVKKKHSPGGGGFGKITEDSLSKLCKICRKKNRVIRYNE